MTLLESRDAFLSWLGAKGYSSATIRLRRAYVGYFIAFMKDRAVGTVEEVTRGMVDEYREWVMKRPHAITGRPLSPRTVRHHLETVKAFFRFLWGRNVLLVNPAAHLVWRCFPRSLPKSIPTKEEMEKILSLPDIGTLTGLRDRAILEVMYSSGIRRKELTGLDLYDLNLADRTLRVRRGKGGKDRMLPLGSEAAAFLGRYLKESRPGLEGVRGSVEGSVRDPALFITNAGGRMKSDRLGGVVAGYVRAVKPGADLGCHIIRHAFATHMLQGGAELAMIQRMLGHSRIETTEIYTRVTPVDLKAEHRRCHPHGRDHENP